LALGKFKSQTIAVCFSFVFIDDISEEKWVKEASVFNRNLRQQLTAKDKETPKNALNPGNNPMVQAQ
jgi:hypothetical protein